MASLLAPGLALTTANAIPISSSKSFFVRAANGGAAFVEAHVLAVDEDRDLALLEVTPSVLDASARPLALRLPSQGAEWQSMVKPGRTHESPLQRLSGTVGPLMRDGRLALQANESPPFAGSNGAPVISDDVLVGILSVETSLRCYVIPITLLQESTLWPLIQSRLPHLQPGSSSGPPAEEHPWFERLSPSARQVLSVTDGLLRAVQGGRNHQGLPPGAKLLLEYLVTALAEEEGGPLPALMQRKSVDPRELAARIEAASRTPIPPRGSYEVTPLEALPPLSLYMKEALGLAVQEATARRSESIQSAHLLHGVLSVNDSPLVQAMAALGLSRDLITFEDSGEPLLVGFRPDDLRGVDRLGIDPEVDALVSVLAAKDVEPPLSLGLFGDWGSGKSFFMRQLEKSIDALAAKASPGYCEKIVQIRFNAWNYIDTENLWASLTSEIFEQLARKVSQDDRGSGAMQRARLLAATASSRDVLTEAQQKKANLETSLRSSEERLQKLALFDANLKANLRDVVLERGTLQRIMETTGLGKQAEALSAKLRLPLDKATPEGVQQLLELRSLGGRLQAFWRALRAKPAGEQQRFFLLVLVCLGAPLLATLVAPYFTKAWKEVSGALGVLGLGGLFLKLQPFLKAARTAVGQMETAWNAATAQIEDQKQVRRVKLEDERKTLASQVDQAQRSVEEATAALRDMEAQLDALGADRQVSEFIRQRHESTDYTQHLGVIARAHQDFERLTELLKDARDEHSREALEPTGPEARERPPALPHIDRIILYIDDLDRCPEDKVVEVLQAVHLLLAFELFVVVVGVDSRWLLHSLQQHSAVFQSSLRSDTRMSSEERHHWQSTPLNYLEKIFQIPYALRVMEPRGFGALIDDLTQSPAASPPLGATTPHDLPQQVSEPANGPQPQKVTALPAPATEGTRDPVPPPPPAPLILRITEEERRFMKQLHGLIPSPRAAKRFVNTYRLMHALLPASERAAFIGTPEQPGECQVAQFLMALLIGYPAEAVQVLEALIEQEPQQSWWSFIQSTLHGDRGDGQPLERWAEMWSHLEELHEQQLFSDDLACGVFVKWAPRVARYSFQGRSVLLARRKKEAPPRLRAAAG
ncbi:P-loop NTPase fold protein [Corallococcus llansteffanensis]|nr:P-loop NTPase fold protein [Corallococcus llansteffanensis]